MNRKDIFDKKIIVPESSEKYLIVKPIYDTIGYQVKGWEFGFFRGRLTEERYYSTIRMANRIVQSQWCKRKNMKLEGPAEMAKKGFLVAVVLLCIGFLFMVYTFDSDEKGNMATYVAFGCFGIALFLAIYFFFVAMSLDGDAMDFSSKTSSLLKKYLNSENKLIYNRFGFDWRIGKDFYWLEIHKMG